MKLNNIDIYQLKEKAQYKKLICFGMGQVLRDFLEDFAFMGLEEQIFAIADNKINESGQYMVLNGFRYTLIGIEELMKNTDSIILISCADVDGVFGQLNQYECLKNTECCAVYFVRSQTNKTDEKRRRYPATFRLTKEPRIPKKIHYCWFGGNPIPEQNLKWMESWRHFCPDYEIIRWDEGNYNVSKNVYMREAYEKKKWGFVSDYARLDIIYNYGGIYLDTDVELVRSYDELLYQPAFCGIEANRKIAIGLGFGAERHNLIIKNLLDLYKDIFFLDRKDNLSLITCVRLQHPFYKKKGFLENGNYQILDGMTVYPESVLSPKDVYTGEVLITKNTFSIHHYDGSWTDEQMSHRIKKTKELYKKMVQDSGEEK